MRRGEICQINAQFAKLFTKCHSPKKASYPVLMKKSQAYVGEIDPWSQFHQYSTSSFCTSRFKLILLAFEAERKVYHL